MNGGNHEVNIIDAKVEKLTISDVIIRLKDFEPDYIGITGMTYEADVIHEMAAAIKKVFPQKPIIIGGSHASTSASEAVKDPNVDIAVSGEGEEAMMSLIDYFEAGKDSFDIPGVVYLKDGEVIENPRQIPDYHLDELPFPAWDLVDFEKYFA